MASESSRGKGRHQHAGPYVYRCKQHIAHPWCFLAWSYALPRRKNPRDTFASEYDDAGYKNAEEEQKWIFANG